MRVDGAPRLRARLAGAVPVRPAGEGREQRNGGAAEQRPGAGDVELAANDLVRAVQRDGQHVEGGNEQVRRDRHIGQRRVEGLAGPAAQSFVFTALDGERWPESETAHRGPSLLTSSASRRTKNSDS